MSLVLRFVDTDGCIKERFFGLLHVKDTASLTLKNGIFRCSLVIILILSLYEGKVMMLSLVVVSKEVYHVQHFFEKLNFIVNIVSASCKRNDQLRDAHASNMAFLLVIGDLESGKGLNQLGSLQRARDTR
ncbi:unnamed protein product [Rhodiola kirilowii]